MKIAYELMVILKPMLPEDIKSGVEKKINDLVAKFKGKITNTDVWGKRHLAYRIGKHEEGYYILYDFEMESQHINEFQSEIKIMSDIVRYIIIRKDRQ